MGQPTVVEQKIESIVTEGLNSVYDELIGAGPDSADEFIEYVANAAREYAKICVDGEYERNSQHAF